MMIKEEQECVCDKQASCKNDHKMCFTCAIQRQVCPCGEPFLQDYFHKTIWKNFYAIKETEEYFGSNVYIDSWIDARGIRNNSWEVGAEFNKDDIVHLSNYSEDLYVKIVEILPELAFKPLEDGEDDFKELYFLGEVISELTYKRPYAYSSIVVFCSINIIRKIL